MRRFHHADLPASGPFALAGDEGEHLVRVLRARPGDEVLVFDGRGRECRCRVVAAERREDPVLEVVAATEPRRAERDVIVCPAVPRGDRMEWLVEKCTEAGASAVLPWAAARSVRDHAGASNLRRWRRSALEACKQCGRADVPDVADVAPLEDVLRAVAGRRLLVAAPGAETSPIAACAESRSAAVVIGPEGGFDPREEAALAAAGAVAVGLGPLVLRIETAALVAVHAIASAR